MVVKVSTKEKDKILFLYFSSFHPRSLKSSIPYVRFLRLKRNSTFERDFQQNNDVMAAAFHQQGYPHYLIN